MNSFRATILLLVVCAVAAEPPRFRTNRYKFQRQEEDPSPTTQASSSGPYPPPAAAPYPPAMPAPYPPSGSKPSGRLFALPVRQAQLRDIYGPPSTQQPVEPEPVEPTTTTPDEESTAEATTTEPLSENIEVDQNNKVDQKTQRLTQQGGPGFYYVQLPQLQQQQQAVAFVNQQAESAQLKQLPAAPVVAAVAPQPLVVANQPFVVSGYYVSTQSW